MQNRLLFLFTLSFLCLSCASLPEKPLEKNASLSSAEQFSQESKDYYNKAVTAYTQILQSADKNKKEEIYYKLGRFYFEHANYPLAIENLLNAKNEEAQKLLAIAFYKGAKYTEALALFNTLGEKKDDAYLYYYALTCEFHNLYSQALKIYEKISSPALKAEAAERIKQINQSEREVTLGELDPKIRALVVNAPGEKDYPQAGAVVLLADEQINVSNKDTVEYIQHFLIKVLNDRGEKYGEIEIGYDSTYDKVVLDFARVIRPDGKVISVGAKHVRDVSRYLNFPLYSNAKAKIISMPEISKGCVIEYQARLLRNKMIAQNKFDTEYILQTSEPIQNATFSVSLPHGTKLARRVLNQEFNFMKANLDPKIVKGSNKDTYLWEFKDIPQIVPEPLMPPLSEITPEIILSTFNGWQDIYTWWHELYRDKITANEEMKKKVAELTKGLTGLKEKVTALYNFCAREVRYVAIEYGEAGHEPHPASEIFANKYGDCKDKVILLVSLLKEIGVEAYPVLIGTRGAVNISDDFPLVAFNHAIVLVHLENENIFLDPTAETVLFGDLPVDVQGRRVFVYFPEKGELMTTPKFPADHNRVVTKTTLHFVDDETVEGTRFAETSGFFDQAQRYRLRYTMPKLIEEGLKEGIQDILPGGKLINYTINNLDSLEKTISLSYNFKGTDFLTKAGPEARVIPQLTDVNLAIVSKDERLYDIDYHLPQSQEDTVEVKIPKGYIVEHLPESIIRETPWFYFENAYQFKDNTVIFTERNILKVPYVETQEYPAYKKTMEELSKQVRQCIILERAKKDEP